MLLVKYFEETGISSFFLYAITKRIHETDANLRCKSKKPLRLLRNFRKLGHLEFFMQRQYGYI